MNTAAVADLGVTATGAAAGGGGGGGGGASVDRSRDIPAIVSFRM